MTIATVSYRCDHDKTIQASLYQSATRPPAPPGEPPTPGGSAHVVLPDGRALDLKQTISADGVRYSDGDPNQRPSDERGSTEATRPNVGNEHFVFWSKGNTALVLENNVEKSYIGCVQVDPQ